MIILGLLWLNNAKGQITPEFEQIGPLCQFSIPPSLPDTSLNGISGTWRPDTISTDSAGIFTYVFTPDSVQNAIGNTMYITINPEVIPYFVRSGELCQFSTPPALLDTSLNGITGTWMPPFIDTSIPGLTTYIFTPDAGQCAVVTVITIIVLENPQVQQVIVMEETGSLQDGSINIIASGITPQLFYSIDNGNSWQTDNGLFPNLSAGNYDCIVKDENDCDTVFNVEIISSQGIHENNTSRMMIYPNPGNGLFEVYLPGDAGATADLKVINAVGAVVQYKYKIVVPADGRIDINLSGCADGVYSLIICTKKSVLQGKLILRDN